MFTKKSKVAMDMPPTNGDTYWPMFTHFSFLHGHTQSSAKGRFALKYKCQRIIAYTYGPQLCPQAGPASHVPPSSS